MHAKRGSEMTENGVQRGVIWGVEKGGSNRGRGQNRGVQKFGCLSIFWCRFGPFRGFRGVQGGSKGGVQRGVQRVDFGQISGRGGRKGGFTSFAV